jgi:hypothetical protein
MAIATDSLLLQEILERRAGTQSLVIANYAFGSDGFGPKHEVDLKVHYVIRDGRASVTKVEADNGRSKPCWEKIWLPEVVINELEAECTADYENSIASEDA